MATVAAAVGRSRDAEAELNLPPGFRFHPTDEELVAHYLCRKVARQALPVPIIAEVDLYKFDPWDLPERALFGRKEWYFFTPRDRKYPNGSRPNRAAGLGYWKATGADKPVGSRGGGGRAVGIKKALVFYSGKAPRGAKTDWIMHEYRLADTNGAPATKKGGHKLDEWVLCRLYNKKNNWDKEKEKEKAKTEAERREAVAAPKDAVADTMSDSLQTHDSEMDTVWGLRDSGDMTAQGPMSNGGIMMKEDNDWFMDLNLDDLQASCMGLPPTVSPAGGQDYCYLPSPFGSAQAKMWQANFPPF